MEEIAELFASQRGEKSKMKDLRKKSKKGVMNV